MKDDEPQKFDDIIHELQHKTPFSPFVIIMSSGDRYQIDDPFTMVNHRADLFVADPRSGKILRLRKTEVVGLEILEQNSAA